jgi:hypothetical protein
MELWRATWVCALQACRDPTTSSQFWDAGLLDRVERYDGLTVEEIAIGAGAPIDVLIAKTQSPLPRPVQLPNRTMQILVATTITSDEMK